MKGAKTFMIILVAVALLVSTCTAIENTTSCGSGGCKDPTITVVTPEDGGTFYIDVVPAKLTIHAIVDAPNGISNITISTGKSHWSIPFNNELKYEFYYELPYAGDFDKFGIVVVDKLGKSDHISRRFTVVSGLPPEGTITVYGDVFDMNHTPISGATVSFETVKDGGTIFVNTTTGDDGKFKVNAIGLSQKVTTVKEGYIPNVMSGNFRPYDNNLTITLGTPKETPGFGLIAGLLAVFAVIVYCKRR
jgi:hypothetical protein